ncbi:DUF3549 family protein [Microbulbifer sp. 2205BS26-8]|uniref:DUF3549 family protein n=1 Tax=Microbulbifer sp. 2205BS26-8 TaxID=3064386 RepID=UPI00273D32F6|nr:DUF3549 family protein [Microbulbifer sp. 2205BS26-8]MDP5210093.1 DUF3549 family protein [Microbulbifer sp. 2205BS26-8]
MKAPGTLTALIEGAGFQLHWFDLGRRLQALSDSAAEAFEAGQAPWPHPYLRQAWTGLLLRPVAGGEAAVWFLRFPLDEQGKLQLAARDHLLHAMTRELNCGIQCEAAEQLDQLLKRSGLLYTPSMERRAVFHARTGMLLKRPASAHYGPVLDYIRAPKACRWDTLALQGIADLAVRWKKEKALLLPQIAHIASPVFIHLCACLENERIDHRLAETIKTRAVSTLHSDTPDCAVITAAVRACSHSPAKALRHALLLQLLQDPSTAQSVQLLATIGSCCVTDLENPALARLWLNALALTENQETFNRLLLDLLFIPQVRASLLTVLRDPGRNALLAQTFGRFLHGSPQ